MFHTSMKPTNKSLNISFDFKLNPNPSPSPAKSVFSHSNHHLPPTNHQTHKITHAPKLSLRFGYYDMSESVRICSSSRPINASYSSPKLSPRFFDSFSFSFTSRFSFSSLATIRRFRSTLPVLKQQGSLEEDLDDSPVSVELQPITSDAQFERVIADAKQLQEAVVIVWMATWCRKCIYIKPKLEKLAAEYYPRLRFYCVDVNTVPYKLVAHAGVTRMPTIQLWRDGEKQAEVIGGHKAYLVINEIREIIENECTV